MSTQSVKICDIDNCGQIATDTWKDFLYQVQGAMGYSYKLIHNVDLCAKHDGQYSRAIPLVHIKGDNAHRGHEEDIKA